MTPPFLSSLSRRYRSARQAYPPQFWLLFWGMLISTIGGSMIWPFLMIYVSGKLLLPLATVASLMTLSSIMGLVFSFIAGPVTDRAGRKWVMVISLLGNALGYLLMSRASTLPEFAVLMAFNGAVNPLYRVGADAMMADLIPPEQRADAYSLMRLSNNIGVSIGPAVGGFIAGASYSLAFYLAALGMTTYSLLIAFRGVETLARRIDPAGRGEPGRPAEQSRERFGGYERILRDTRFMSFVTSFTMTQICAALIWVLFSVYTKTNFGLPERLYGWLPTTNAVMVVLFQLWVTQRTKLRPPLRMMALGSLLYAVGVGSVALGRNFGGFWLSMVILTVGELILVPTATTYAANLAPADMRGRYMSIYGLTWGLASGIGPIFGGLLNDHLGPAFIWYGGFGVGMIAVLTFMVLAPRFPSNPAAEAGAVGD